MVHSFKVPGLAAGLFIFLMCASPLGATAGTAGVGGGGSVKTITRELESVTITYDQNGKVIKTVYVCGGAGTDCTLAKGDWVVG